MGTIQHSAIIVTSWEEKKLERAFKKANNLFEKGEISQLCGQGINGYKSFMIAPCGSKLGWDPHSTHEKALDDFEDYLKSLAYDDGSSAIDYVRVNYGELGASMNSNCEEE